MAVLFIFVWIKKYLIIVLDMVLLELVLMARTQNVAEIRMPENSDWHLVIKCGTCNEQFPKQITFSKLDQHQVIKQSVNFYAKCKNCERKGSISILPKSTYVAKPDEDGNVKDVLAIMDCRGLDICQVVLGNSLTVVATSGSEFENADFTDLWAQVDEKTTELIQVQDQHVEINKAK